LKSLKYFIALSIAALAITPSIIGQINVFNTGVQGCCDLLDPNWTLTAAPTGVTLGNTFSTPTVSTWVTPSAGSAWINPFGDNGTQPAGNYTYQETFSLNSATGNSITGEFAADNSAMMFLNGTLIASTVNGIFGFEQFTPFSADSGFLVGTNTIDIVVNNAAPSPTGLEVEISGASGIPTTTPEPSSLLLMGSGVLALAGVVRRKRKYVG
jgi:PEP-CTERM motif